jgi:molecular chaperone IbpA
MTYLKFPEHLEKFFIGSDQLQKTFDLASQVAKNVTSNFPPYNIRKTKENKYVIEMAVAGFSKQDIELTLEQNRLVVKGNISSENNGEYIFKGIADRGFTRHFTIADNFVIENAQLLNGMLSVWLEHIIPESQKIKKIEINDVSEETTKKNKKQFLSE